MLRILPATFKPVWRQFRLLQVAKSLLQKVENSSVFTTESVHVARFTGLRANLFCCKWPNSRVWRDSRVILSNQKSASTQLETTLKQLDLVQDGFDYSQHHYSSRFAAMLQNKFTRFRAYFTLRVVLLPKQGWQAFIQKFYRRCLYSRFMDFRGLIDLIWVSIALYQKYKYR